LKATEQPIDTSTAASKCFLDMLGVFAEFETNLRRAPPNAMLVGDREQAARLVLAHHQRYLLRLAEVQGPAAAVLRFSPNS
jgi:DNA invertase Pin-like site-specific DNA recombinase